MMKKTMLVMLALLLLTAAVFGGIELWTRNTPVIGESAVVPQDIALRNYTLFPASSKDGERAAFVLENPQRARDLMLVISVSRPFELMVNGETAYRYPPDAPYVRAHGVMLSPQEDRYEIEMRLFRPGKPLKIQLSTTQRHARIERLTHTANCVLIGIMAAMFFYFLSLYLHKRSEKYLLAQCLMDIVFLVMTVIGSGSFVLPITDATYLNVMKVGHVIQPFAVHAALFLLSDPPADALAGRVRDNLPALGGLILLSRVLVEAFGLDLQYYILLTILFFVSLHLFAYTLPKRMPGVIALCISYILWFAIAIYSIWFNRGLLPKPTMFVYVYVSQMAVALYLAACMYCANCRFAGKFAQADMLIAELDARVEERTAQLIQQQNVRRSMMVNIFHDLRSPLFAARGCADMMCAQDQQNRECLQVIRGRLDFLTELTEQIFLVAKLEDGQITFARERVDVRALCRYLAQETAAEAQTQGKRFVFEGDAPLAVTGDGFRLKQALSNLLANALKFTREGGQITLSFSEQEGMAAICVRDTGSGISREDLPHVFERYYHGHNTDKQRSTGLGLTIAYEIAKAHGGRIDVQSALGEGTAFTLLLPRSEQE